MFDRLDAVLDMLVREHDLNVGFELMGNPVLGTLFDGPYLFTSWLDPLQISAWKRMVSAIAARYVGRYGLDTVRAWRWETWNEPDHACSKEMKANIKCDYPSWQQYYDASAQGLMDVHPDLIFGGPGTGGDTLSNGDFLTGLIKHVANSTKYTADRGLPRTTKLDFLQWHGKGVLAIGSKPSNTAQDIVIIRAALQASPALTRTTPLGNEEADPLGGWNKQEVWRGDATYPAAAARARCSASTEIYTRGCHWFLPSLEASMRVANAIPLGCPPPLTVATVATVNSIQTLKVLNMHLHNIGPLNKNKEDADLAAVAWGYHGNDNAFLNYGDVWFDQRTLVCRFMMNETNPPTVEVVKKPIISLMAMLSLLGDVALYGARFPTEIYTRGCHWIPRMFA
jgi:L-iduronidase